MSAAEMNGVAAREMLKREGGDGNNPRLESGSRR
jgi:hypothetical protein